MIKKISIAVLVIGLVVALYAALTSTAEAPEPPLAGQPPRDPFDRSIAASGIVEARSENVEVATPLAGLVMEVLAEVNDEVEAGTPLLRLDARPLEAQLTRERAAFDERRAELDRLLAEPRAERAPILRAEAARLEALAKDAQDFYQSVRDAFEADSATERERRAARFEAEAARAAADRAEAELQLLLDGAWEQEIRIARRRLDAAQAAVDATRTLIDRRIVRAPLPGTILKRNIEPGEYVQPDSGEPPFVMGDLSELRIRAEVNEEDVAATNRIASAIARPRGQGDRRVELEYLFVEPLAIPKRQLTGAPAELIDTRVVDFIFRVTTPGEPRLYPGQLVDVFIELEPANERSDSEADPAGAQDAGA